MRSSEGTQPALRCPAAVPVCVGGGGGTISPGETLAEAEVKRGGRGHEKEATWRKTVGVNVDYTGQAPSELCGSLFPQV